MKLYIDLNEKNWNYIAKYLVNCSPNFMGLGHAMLDRYMSNVSLLRNKLSYIYVMIYTWYLQGVYKEGLHMLHWQKPNMCKYVHIGCELQSG